MARIGGDQAHEKAEVQDVSSTARQPTQVLRRSSHLALLLFGCSCFKMFQVSIIMSICVLNILKCFKFQVLGSFLD